MQPLRRLNGLGLVPCPFGDAPVPVDQTGLLVDFDLGASLEVINPLLKVQDRLLCLLEVNGWDWVPTLGLVNGEPLDWGRQEGFCFAPFIYGLLHRFRLEGREFFHPRFIPDSMQTLGGIPDCSRFLFVSKTLCFQQFPGASGENRTLTG